MNILTGFFEQERMKRTACGQWWIYDNNFSAKVRILDVDYSLLFEKDILTGKYLCNIAPISAPGQPAGWEHYLMLQESGDFEFIRVGNHPLPKEIFRLQKEFSFYIKEAIKQFEEGSPHVTLNQ
jgi:hypothetical protein